MVRDRSQRAERSIQAALLEFVRQPDYRPLSQRQLLHRLQLKPGQREAARRELERLIETGQIVRLAGGRVGPAAQATVVRGALERHPDGFGFVVPEGGGEDLFVPGGALGESMSGDVVEARVRRRGRSGRPEGEIVRTLTRRSRIVLGVFEETGPGGTVHPFDPSLRGSVTIPAAFRFGAGHRDVVEIQLMRPPGPERPAEGKVLEVLGGFDTPGIDIEVAIRRFGLNPTFPDDVAEAERTLPARFVLAAKSSRKRFDDPPTVTIDGETAQDFDDAIAVADLPKGGFRLWVHIADVAHFVEPGDPIDLEARRRGTSVYFPGRVLPMLPERLSNDLCSLRPGVDRLVHTVILDLDATGALRKTAFADGVIRSAARLTYTQVAELIERGAPVAGIPPRVVPMLETAERLRAVLRAKRKARGGIDVDLPEPRILLDVEGVMTGITIEPRNRAHQLIEECMIAANEAVASWLEERGAPCMFRNHDRPDPLKLEQLAEFARALGLALPDDPEAIDARAISRLLESADGRPERPVLGMMALRSMQQARYAMQNRGHFGLASISYCHFTSPIRRYPDLVVHRLLRQARGRRGVPADATDGFEELAAVASERERNAEAAERDVLAWKKVAFIAGREGEVFDGVVTGVARFGIFVQLAENLVEGLVKIERLGQEYFEFDEARMELMGSRSGTRFRIGDSLRVRVERVDRVLRRVDLGPEDAEGGASPTERAKPAGPPGPRGRARGASPFRGRGRRRRS